VANLQVRVCCGFLFISSLSGSTYVLLVLYFPSCCSVFELKRLPAGSCVFFPPTSHGLLCSPLTCYVAVKPFESPAAHSPNVISWPFWTRDLLSTSVTFYNVTVLRSRTLEYPVESAPLTDGLTPYLHGFYGYFRSVFGLGFCFFFFWCFFLVVWFCFLLGFFFFFFFFFFWGWFFCVFGVWLVFWCCPS